MEKRTVTHLNIENIQTYRYLLADNFTIEQANSIKLIEDEAFNVPIDDYYIAKSNFENSNNKFIWHGNSKSVAEFVNTMNEFINKWETK